MKIVQNSSTYWEGKSDAESLQRIYGISFPDTKQLKEWQKLQEEAAKRDHRKIGRVSVYIMIYQLIESLTKCSILCDSSSSYSVYAFSAVNGRRGLQCSAICQKKELHCEA